MRGYNSTYVRYKGRWYSFSIENDFHYRHPSVKYIHHKSPSQSKPNPILITPIPTPTVLLPSYRPLTVHPLPPLISHNIIPHTIHPYTIPYIPQNTHHTQYISIPKASFVTKCLYFLIDKYLKLSYNKIKG